MTENYSVVYLVRHILNDRMYLTVENQNNHQLQKSDYFIRDSEYKN